MRIIIKQNKISCDLDNPDTENVSDAYILFKQALLAVGYQPESIDEAILVQADFIGLDKQ